jgi:hypothetical protein
MSQTDVTFDPQTVASGLVPLLKEYAQRLAEIGTSARRLQRIYAKAQIDVQQAIEARRRGHNVPTLDTQIEKQQPAQRAKADFENLRFTFNRLLPSTTDLSRQASQLVEHGKLEPVTRLELALRLADFESALRQAQQRIGAGVTG